MLLCCTSCCRWQGARVDRKTLAGAAGSGAVATLTTTSFSLGRAAAVRSQRSQLYRSREERLISRVVAA